MPSLNHGLSDTSLATLHKVLSPFATHITHAGLFGSRATGNYRPNSDIDLVLYGDLDPTMVGSIALGFEESSLPYKVDVVAYPLITYTPFREHIDAVMRPLFMQADLLHAMPSTVPLLERHNSPITRP